MFTERPQVNTTQNRQKIKTMTNPIHPPTDSIQEELNKLQAKRDRLQKLIKHIDMLSNKPVKAPNEPPTDAQD